MCSWFYDCRSSRLDEFEDGAVLLNVKKKAPRLTPKLFLTLDERREGNIRQIAGMLEEVFVVKWLMPMPPQMPF